MQNDLIDDPMEAAAFLLMEKKIIFARPS